MRKVINYYRSLKMVSIATISIAIFCLCVGIWQVLSFDNLYAHFTFSTMALMYMTGAFSLIDELNKVEVEYNG